MLQSDVLAVLALNPFTTSENLPNLKMEKAIPNSCIENIWKGWKFHQKGRKGHDNEKINANDLGVTK